MQGTRLGELIRLLQQRTEERKILWQETVDENIYQAAFPNYTVQIGYKKTTGSWGEEGTEYLIKILDESSKIIEEATNVDLNSEIEGSYKIMENLYRSIRRQTMGLDKAIDSILSVLQDDNTMSK